MTIAKPINDTIEALRGVAEAEVVKMGEAKITPNLVLSVLQQKKTVDVVKSISDLVFKRDKIKQWAAEHKFDVDEIEAERLSLTLFRVSESEIEKKLKEMATEGLPITLKSFASRYRTWRINGTNPRLSYRPAFWAAAIHNRYLAAEKEHPYKEEIEVIDVAEK